ncbi:MAG TPA: YraN family protein [Actinomycetota bacterium]|nr:YraN family protein [Actinomycetota bacterium]
MARDRVWHDGERAAWEVYRRRGFRLVARNWRSPLGELDLVVERDGLVAFCEVKARSSSRLGGGHEAVTASKQRKVRALAEAFIAARGGPERYRFDVASVRVRPDGRADVHLFEDAF